MAVKQDKRRQSRGARDSGREKLLEAARDFFRTNTRPEVSRQEIARLAGATPALMSYHFASNAELVLGAAQPILAQAIGKLIAVIDGPEPLEVRFRQIIGLFIDFARSDAILLDVFVVTIMEHADQGGQMLILSCIDKLSHFFGECVDASLMSRDTNPRFLLLALWGICRLVAEVPTLPFSIFDPGSDPRQQRETVSDLILNLVLHGAATAPRATRSDVGSAERNFQ